METPWAPRRLLHDLRAPLDVVHGCVDLLQQRHAPALPAEGQDLLRLAREGLDQARGLLLDAMRRQQALRETAALKPVDVGDLLRGALRELDRDLREASLRVVAGPLPVVLADEMSLRRVLLNLLHNAVRHAPGSGIVSVRAALDEARGECRITVADRGPGIAPRDQWRIFLPRGEGGHGLGLANCLQLADHMDGRLWLESAPGKGAAFHLDLPLARA